ncbi:MAG: ATP-binding protein [Mycobacterium sp.]|nr:ATP-binding protein [Mycobacterium sp.]
MEAQEAERRRIAYDLHDGVTTALASMAFLVAGIESLVKAVSSDTGPSIVVHVDPAAVIEDIPDYAATALYRIAQEALSNAVKHAEADRIVVSLRRVGSSVVLGCTDDGKGFDPEARRAARAADADGAQHFGMSSIAERCAIIEASLRVESALGRGTTVLVELPVSSLTNRGAVTS